MVSLALLRLTFHHVMLIAVIFISANIVKADDGILPQIPISRSGQIELKHGKMFFTFENSGKFLTRRNDFGYIISFQNNGVMPVTGRTRTNYDSLGGGGGLTAGYTLNDKYSIELSFQGASARSERSSRLVSTFGGIRHAVPIINGQSFGRGQQLLQFTGSPDNTRNIRTKLDYETWYIDTFLGLNRTIVKETNTEIHGIAGLTYAHFEQDYEHEIIGVNRDNGLLNSSNLDEDLRDNLFGFKSGLRLSRRVTKKIQIEGTVFGGAYYRKSKLDADQTLKNMNPFFFVDYIDAFVSVNDRDSHIVPRAEGSLKIKYKINDRWNLSFSSGMGAWWHMSKINNPENGTSNFASGILIDKPVHIGDNDRLIEYQVGFVISFRR